MLRIKINKIKWNGIKFIGVLFCFYNGVIVHNLLCLPLLLSTVIYTCTSMNDNIINFYGIVFSSSVCILLVQLLCLSEMLQIIPKPSHLEWKENIIKWGLFNMWNDGDKNG